MKSAVSAVLEGVAPPGWIIARLDELAQVQLGRQRSPKNHSGPHMRRYVRAANVTWEGLALDDVKQMNFDPAEFARYRLEPGDLLLAEGSGSPEEVGKPALWQGELPDCAFQNTLVRIRPFEEVDRRYLLHLLWYEARVGNFGSASRGVNIHHIGARTLSEWPIALPPRAEQLRIVAIIEEQFSRLAAAQNALRRSKARLALFRDSVVEDAFGNHTDAVPLGELAVSVTDGPFGSNLKSSHYTSSGPRVIRLANIGNGVFVDEEAHISTEHFQRLEKYSVREGDVIVASLGGRHLRSCVLPAHVVPAIAKADCIRVRFDPDMNPRFVNYALQRPSQGRRARQLIHGVGRPRLGLSAIRSLEVPVASPREQAEIVELIDRRLSLVDTMSKEVENALTRCDAVRRAVLTGALAGRLAPQDSARAPASHSSARATT